MMEFARGGLSRRADPLRLVIYDCDGVLVDSEAIADRLVAEELTALGWTISAEESGSLFLGISYEDMCPMIEVRLGRALPEDWLAKFLVRIVTTMREEAELVPGALEALRETDRMGLDWRVASNSSHAEMAVKFERTGLTGLVAGRLHSAHDVMASGGRAKPAPDLFLAVADAAGVTPPQCLVVEDSPAGIRAARAAGMMCLALARHDDGTVACDLGAIPFTSMWELPGLLRQAQARVSC